MRNLSKIMLPSFIFLAIGLSTITIGLTSTPVFADKEKNQNLSPKIDCEIHINAEDHLNDNDFGPNEEQCLNNSNNIKDSTVTQNPSDGGDFDSPTVVSVDPNDNQNNVALNTDIKVTFDEKMDEDTLDDGSLNIFNLDGGTEPGVNANPSSKSVTYTLDKQLEPGTRYEAELDFGIEDEDGNFLDCSNSNDVDSSCRWQFETTGSSSASIELSPTSGPIGTSVHISGTGFDSNSDVIITFGIFRAASSTNNNGEFSDNFDVPISTIGPHTVTASDGFNSDSATFTVTTPTNPVISINPDSGPVGTSVDIIGINFDQNSDIVITFAGTAVTTTPSPVTTNSSGAFFANFTVPLASTIGLKTVTAIDQESNSDSTFFDVTVPPTPLSTNQRLSTNLSNVSSIENSSLPPTSQSSSPNLSEKMILPDIFA